MKKSFLYLGLSVFLSIACNKDKNCEEVSNPACDDVVPRNEACQAYFVRYFHTSSGCTQIGYSGCSQKGFETLAECEACDCD